MAKIILLAWLAHAFMGNETAGAFAGNKKVLKLRCSIITVFLQFDEPTCRRFGAMD